MTIDPRVADEIHDKTISVPVGYVYEKKIWVVIILKT